MRHEAVAVPAVRTAVDVEHDRVATGTVEVSRQQQPGLDGFTSPHDVESFPTGSSGFASGDRLGFPSAEVYHGDLRLAIEAAPGYREAPAGAVGAEANDH